MRLLSTVVAATVLALSGYLVSQQLTAPTASAVTPQERALIEKAIYHLKRTTISYPQWLKRSYPPGVREQTEWGKAFAALNAALQQTTTTAATSSPATTTAPGTTTTATTTDHPPPPTTTTTSTAATTTTAPPPTTTATSTEPKAHIWVAP